jgi:hypothetical protein
MEHSLIYNALETFESFCNPPKSLNLLNIYIQTISIQLCDVILSPLVHSSDSYYDYRLRLLIQLRRIRKDDYIILPHTQCQLLHAHMHRLLLGRTEAATPHNLEFLCGQLRP